ncbi:MAG: FecR domain-containing protein [Minisyncoccia bacterium]
MKNNLTILIGAGVVVVVAAGFFLSRGDSSPLAPVVISDILVPTIATTLAPDLTLIVASSSKSILVTSTTTVNVGDTLVTSHNGRGLLQEANGTETLLDYDTKLTLTSSDSTGTHVSRFLGTGATWSRVKKVFGKGEYYEIRTQNAVAVVRGTSFSIGYRNHRTTLKVATGTVSFMPTDPSTGEPIDGKEVFVSGEHGATVDDLGTAQVFQLTAKDKSDSWYLFNVSDDAATSHESTTPAASSPDAQSSQPKTPPAQTSPATTQQSSTVSGATVPTRAVTVFDTGNTCGSSDTQGASKTGTSLTFASVSPSLLSQSSQGLVTLKGVGFNCVLTITIGGKALSGESDFVVVDNATITISSGILPIGTSDITIDDTLGNIVRMPKAITVTR